MSVFKAAVKIIGSVYDDAAKLKRAKDQGFGEETFYHGTPQGADFTKFDYKYTGKGNDQYGAGFYLTDSTHQANSYAGVPLQGQSNTVIPTYARSANLLQVDGTKANNLGDIFKLDQAQTRQVLEKAKPLKRGLDDEEMNPFGDRYDSFWDEGSQDWMYDQLSMDQAGRDPHELIDFFDGDTESYLRALSEATGYDGLNIRFGDGVTNQVHWKPENIRSVNAKFDPSKTDSSNLLSSILTGGVGLSVLNSEKAEQ